MTDNEKRLLERAEALRRALIQAGSWLAHGNVDRAARTINEALNRDG